MRISYQYHGNNYIFVWFEGEHWRNTIVCVSNPNTDQEKLHHIPCRHKAGSSIGINKKSVSAGRGAYGVISFIKRAVQDDLATVYIDRIIDRFVLQEGKA